MDFGEQIKSIRRKENLTQEQFAAKLNVSRQLFQTGKITKIFQI